MNIKYKIVPLTPENLEQLETTRYNAYNFDINSLPISENFHYRMLKDRKYIVYGCYL